MAKKFSVYDLHRLSPAADSASSLHFNVVGTPTCLQTVVDTDVITRAAEDEK